MLYLLLPNSPATAHAFCLAYQLDCSFAIGTPVSDLGQRDCVTCCVHVRQQVQGWGPRGRYRAGAGATSESV